MCSSDLLDLDLSNSKKERLLQLNGLDEFRMQALLHTEVVQLKRNVWHEKNIKEKASQEGYWVFLYDSRFKYFKGKLMTRWLGPYIVEKCFENGGIQIGTVDEEGIPLIFNVTDLKFTRSHYPRRIS